MSRVIGPPEGFCLDLSLRVRSGVMGVQVWPLSVDLKICYDAEYKVLGSWGEIKSGEVQLKRCFRRSAPLPETSSGHTETSTVCSLLLSNRVMMLSAPA